MILRWGRHLNGRITHRLAKMLPKLLAVARENFAGPVTYSAAFWEVVDWTDFDIVGVSLYRFGTDHDGYEARVRSLVASTDKPVVVTEFGCGAQRGGDVRGPGSFRIVNWFASPPRVRDGHERDEATQAAYLTDLIDVYEEPASVAASSSPSSCRTSRTRPTRVTTSTWPASASSGARGRPFLVAAETRLLRGRRAVQRH